ncbi:MAG TPA: PAS domain S-box protein, partial [Polyangiaceae bacterium]
MDNPNASGGEENAVLRRRILELESEVRRAVPYAQMAAGSRDPMALVDLQFRYLAANSAYSRLVQRDEDAIVGQFVAAIVGEAVFALELRPHLTRCFAGETISVETMQNDSALERRCFDIQYSPCPASDGTVTAVAITVRDITTRKRAEEHLQQREARLHAIFDRSPVGIVLSRLSDGQIVDANSAFTRIYGYELSEMIGRTSSELELWVEPSERKAITGLLGSEGAATDLGIRARIKSGEVRDLRVAVDLVRLDGVEYALGLLQDVTEHEHETAVRKHAELALRASEARLRRILEVAPLPLCFLAASGEITFRN